MNLLFDKAAFVILEEPELEDYKYLETLDALKGLERKSFQTYLFD